MGNRTYNYEKFAASVTFSTCNLYFNYEREKWHLCKNYWKFIQYNSSNKKTLSHESYSVHNFKIHDLYNC